MKKIALVTGAAKGIGKALIIELAKNGYDVVINYLSSEDEAKKLEKFIKDNYKVDALVVKADISNEEEVKDMVNKVKTYFGKVDLLINNAALANDNNYVDKTKEEFMRVLEVNVVGTFLVTKYILETMKNGTVINISSTDSEDTYNDLSMDYCASKAGVNLLSKTFSLARSDVKFLSLLLPWVDTESVKEMFPEYLESELKRVHQDRLLEPEEVANKIYSYVDNDYVKSGSVIRL